MPCNITGLMFVGKQFKGSGNKVQPGEGDYTRRTYHHGWCEHGDFKRFKSQIVGI